MADTANTNIGVSSYNEIKRLITIKEKFDEFVLSNTTLDSDDNDMFSSMVKILIDRINNNMYKCCREPNNENHVEIEIEIEEEQNQSQSQLFSEINDCYINNINNNQINLSQIKCMQYNVLAKHYNDNYDFDLNNILSDKYKKRVGSKGYNSNCRQYYTNIGRNVKNVLIDELYYNKKKYNQDTLIDYINVVFNKLHDIYREKGMYHLIDDYHRLDGYIKDKVALIKKIIVNFHNDFWQTKLTLLN